MLEEGAEEGGAELELELEPELEKDVAVDCAPLALFLVPPVVVGLAALGTLLVEVAPLAPPSVDDASSSVDGVDAAPYSVQPYHPVPATSATSSRTNATMPSLRACEEETFFFRRRCSAQLVSARVCERSRSSAPCS